MARQSRPVRPQPKVKRFVGLSEVEAAKGKLQRRIADVKAINPNEVWHEDQTVRNVEENISQAVLEIFGPESPEYLEIPHFSFFRNASTVFSSNEEAQEYFARQGLRDGVAYLDNLIRRIDESAADLASNKTHTIRAAFEGLELHSRIADACGGLYRDGHYTDAVLRATLTLENYVKERSGHDSSGASLMEQVFSPNNPLLAFNPLADQSDKDEQRGLMHLCQGVMLALRNPRAHKLMQDSPEAALEAIGLVSLLAKRVGEAKVVPRK
jgi:uncharacterized protein (TIGR02391 family)